MRDLLRTVPTDPCTKLTERSVWLASCSRTSGLRRCFGSRIGQYPTAVGWRKLPTSPRSMTGRNVKAVFNPDARSLFADAAYFDSAILNRVQSWSNLKSHLLEQYLPEAWLSTCETLESLVSLNSMSRLSVGFIGGAFEISDAIQLAQDFSIAKGSDRFFNKLRGSARHRTTKNKNDRPSKWLARPER